MRISDWSSDVCSSDLLDEALEELRRGDRSRAARPHVLHVGDLAVEQLVVSIGEREPPQFVTRGEPGREQLLGELVVVREQPAVLATERDDHRAGQRREIDDRLGPVRALHPRSEEHTSELPSLMRISYAVSCLKKTNI